MSSSMWGYLFIILGIMAMALLLLFGGINTKDEQNYYLLKEVTEAAMLDSVDDSAYKVGLTQDEVENNASIDCVSGQAGTIRIIKEKFVENFTRRFANVASTNNNYKIMFYDIDECPPKVSLEIISTQNYGWVRRIFGAEKISTDDENAEIVNRLSAILESRN